MKLSTQPRWSNEFTTSEVLVPEMERRWTAKSVNVPIRVDHAAEYESEIKGAWIGGDDKRHRVDWDQVTKAIDQHFLPSIRAQYFDNNAFFKRASADTFAALDARIDTASTRTPDGTLMDSSGVAQGLVNGVSSSG